MAKKKVSTKKFVRADAETINKLRKYWQKANKASDTYWGTIQEIERVAHRDTGIDVEIFHVDGSLVGIGDYEREMKLITGEQFDIIDTEIKDDDN